MLKKATQIACAATALLLASTGTSLAENTNKVARDTGGQVLRSIAHGTCVRTKWEEGTDVCAPAKPAPAPAPAPVVEAPKQVVKERTVLAEDQQVVYFGFDSDAITPEAATNLDRVAQILLSAKDVKQLEIVGHADRKGSAKYNQKLSEKRAAAVQSYLAGKGYTNTSVSQVSGVGQANPVASCDAKEARATEIACLEPDRRVELKVQYNEIERYTTTE